MRTRVLIVAEAVTLAHVARPVALGAGLDPGRFEVHLAAASHFDALLGPLPGAGLLVRSEHATPDAIAGATRRLLSEQGFRARADSVAGQFAAYDAPAAFAGAIEDLS